jgi:hypothetical protein
LNKPHFTAIGTRHGVLQPGFDRPNRPILTRGALNLYRCNVFRLDQALIIKSHAAASRRLSIVQKSRSIPASVAGVTRGVLCRLAYQKENQEAAEEDDCGQEGRANEEGH